MGSLEDGIWRARRMGYGESEGWDMENLKLKLRSKLKFKLESKLKFKLKLKLKLELKLKLKLI